MIPSLRRHFNQEFTAAKYAHLLNFLEERCGVRPAFRINETPCFFPRELIDRTAQYGREILEQLLANRSYLSDAESAVPDRYRVPNEAQHPLFVQADFGLDQDLEPKLVEIQGFPSLYAFQPVLAQCYRDAYGIDLGFLPGDLTLSEYHTELRQAITGDCDPDSVVLLEIDPLDQKTLPDFLLTQKLCGIKTVDIRDLTRRANRLYFEDVEIRRIYNRTIVDELERRNIELQFDFRDDLDVEWAGHPNWFFKLSKFSLPYIRHQSVPRTYFLSDLNQVDRPEDFVLKPLFSFAGRGVVVAPTHEQLAAIPVERRAEYILQERIDFRPAIETPYGATKVEIRIMYIWRGSLKTVNTIIRTGRGDQMGVDYNKGLEWIGASAGFLA